MKSFLLTITTGVLLFSNCHVLDCDPESYQYRLTENKNIEENFLAASSLRFFGINEGENLLFEYIHGGAQCDDVFDDEWGERLTFEVNSDLTEFSVVDSSITTLSCFYHQTGAWVKNAHYPITKGSINGRRVSDTEWDVQIIVYTTPFDSTEEPINIDISANFQME